MAIVVGLVFNFLDADAYLPQSLRFLTTAIEWLGQASIPLVLVLIGATIADEIRAGAGNRSIADGAKVIGWSGLLRLGLLPLSFLAIGLLVPATVELRRVIAVEAAMPSAVFPILLARHCGGSPTTALRVILSTSLLGLITIPLWIAAGMAVLGLVGSG